MSPFPVKFKNTIRPYQSNDLTCDGIRMDSISVSVVTSRTPNVTPNLLVTFWQKSDVDLAAGLDFGPGNVYAQVRKQLQFVTFEIVE